MPDRHHDSQMCKRGDTGYRCLGSTNEAVSYYQLHNLPCPVLKDQRMQDHDRLRDVGIDREAGLIGSQSVQRFPHKRK